MSIQPCRRLLTASALLAAVLVCGCSTTKLKQSVEQLPLADKVLPESEPEYQQPDKLVATWTGCPRSVSWRASS